MPGRVAVESGTVVSVTSELLGDVLAADATAGDSSVTVDDAGDFDEVAGGTLSLGGARYGYTAVDMDTGLITLATPLSANALTGDRVDVWDTVLGTAEREKRANVALAGTEANDDSINAAVAQSLISKLPEGIRDPGAGESVTMQLQDTEWVITDIRGNRSQQLSFVRFIDDGSGAPITYGSAGNRPSILASSAGSDVSFAAYNGTFGISIQGSGIYQVQVDSTVESLDPKDVVRIEAIINSPYPGDHPMGYGVANDTGGGAGTGRAFLTACSVLFAAADVGTTVEVAVDYVSGTAVGKVIDYVGITITKFSLA